MGVEIGKMQAPPDFQLTECRGKFPASTVPRHKKADLYDTDMQFKEVDEHAAKVAREDHRSFRDLLWQLVYGQEYESEVDKARAIFRWMTIKDLNTVKFEDVQPGSPDEIFTSFQNQKATYAKVFEIMCRYSELHCLVVAGFAKGSGYRSGDTFRTSQYRHSWNAVHLNGEWYLVDTKWAARSHRSGTADPRGSEEDCNDFFFLTNPEELIYSHWPIQLEWQLLARPISQKEFIDLPFVTSNFFRCGLRFRAVTKSVLEASKGVVRMHVGAEKPTKFAFKITSIDQYDVQQDSLKRHVLYEPNGSGAVFTLRPPTAGVYYFKIFSKNINENSAESNPFRASLEYKVVVTETASEPVPWPSVYGSSWGLNTAAEKFGISSKLSGAIADTRDDRIKMEFEKTKPVRLFCKLHKTAAKDDNMAASVSHVYQSSKVTVTLTLQNHGEYGLSVFACDPTQTKNRYTHIGQYLVRYTVPTVNGTLRPESPSHGLLAVESQNGHKSPSEEMSGSVSRRFFQKPSRASLKNIFEESNGHDVTQTDHTDRSISPLTSHRLSPVDERSFGEEPPPLPQGFQLPHPLINMDTSVVPLPSVVPHRKPLFDVVDADTMQAADNHAIQVAKSVHKSFRDFMWDLIYSKGINDDMLKVRILFQWLISKKTNHICFEKVEKNSPGQLLMGLDTCDTTYCAAFHTLCSYVGLNATIVTGFAKSSDFQPGQTFNPNSNRHAWNAVCIYGSWYLIDVRMSRKPILGKLTSSGDTGYQFDEHFFLSDPRKLIYTHFPDEPRWQLLDPPITMDFFINMPKLTPQFFAYDLDLLSHKNAVIHTKSELEIRFGYPTHKGAVPLRFTFTVHFEGGQDEYRGTKLTKFGMEERISGTVFLRIRLPERGSYILYIYAKEDSEQAKDIPFTQICDYKIVKDSDESDVSPFPPSVYLNWGPSSGLFRYGLTTNRMAATVPTQGGKVEIKFKLPKTFQFRTKLSALNRKAEEMENCVYYAVIEDMAVFKVSPPARGEYCLEIYAKDPDQSDKKLYHVAQYLIECNEDIKQVNLPKLPPGYLGAQPKFAQLGLATVTHHEPVIHLDSNRVEVQLCASHDIRFTANLIEVDKSREHMENIFIHTQGSTTTFVLNIPSTGFFMFLIHGVAADDQSHQLPALFNYLINCEKVTEKVYPFPKQYLMWKDGCYLWEPLVLHEDFGIPEVRFRVFVPRAQEVAVLVDEEWAQLETTETSIWQGTVQLSRFYGKNITVKLIANYSGDQYTTLLEYHI